LVQVIVFKGKKIGTAQYALSITFLYDKTLSLVPQGFTAMHLACPLWHKAFGHVVLGEPTTP